MPNTCKRTQKWQTYVVVAKEVRKFKIGSAKNPYDRLGELQVGSPVGLTMYLDSLPVPEAIFHTDPCLVKHRSHGEWYYLNEESVNEFYRIFRRNTKPGSRYIPLRFALCEMDKSQIKRCSQYNVTLSDKCRSIYTTRPQNHFIRSCFASLASVC